MNRRELLREIHKKGVICAPQGGIEGNDP